MTLGSTDTEQQETSTGEKATSREGGLFPSSAEPPWDLPVILVLLMYSFVHLISIHWALLYLRHCSKPWECRLGEQIEHVSWRLVLTGYLTLLSSDQTVPLLLLLTIVIPTSLKKLPQPPSSAHPNYHHLFLLLLDYFLTQRKEKFFLHDWPLHLCSSPDSEAFLHHPCQSPCSLPFLSSFIGLLEIHSCVHCLLASLASPKMAARF